MYIVYRKTEEEKQFIAHCEDITEAVMVLQGATKDAAEGAIYCIESVDE